MSHARHWQADAAFPNGAKITFGLRASSLPRALLKAYEHLAAFPRVAEQLTITRLPWRGARKGR
jgi:hypothetical protein